MKHSTQPPPPKKRTTSRHHGGMPCLRVKKKILLKLELNHRTVMLTSINFSGFAIFRAIVFVYLCHVTRQA